MLLRIRQSFEPILLLEKTLPSQIDKKLATIFGLKNLGKQKFSNSEKEDNRTGNSLVN